MNLLPFACTSALLVAPALAQEVPDRAALDALLGTNQTLEDFEAFVVEANDMASLEAHSLDASTVTNGQGPGLVMPGVTYYAPGSNIIQWNGDGWMGVASRSLFINFTCGYVYLDYATPVQAAGLDVSNYANGVASSGTATFLDAAGNRLGTAAFATDGTAGDRDFVGWRHDAGIAQVILRSDTTFWSPVLDDHGYGQLDGELGSSPCQSMPNSTFQVGSLAAYGSDVAADNELLLVASGLPVGEPGYLLNASAQGNLPLGDGTLCLAAPFGRHTAQLGVSDASGTLWTSVDLAALPRPTGPVTVMAGETWHFQLWHRDGTSSNLTSSLAISFQ